MEAEIRGVTRKTFQLPFVVLLFITVLADIDVMAAKLEHAVNQQCELMRRGDNALGFA